MHSAFNWAAWLLQEVGQKVAMHAVAMKPRYLSPDTVPVEALEGIPSTISPRATYLARKRIFIIITFIFIIIISSSTCLPVGIHDSIMCPRCIVWLCMHLLRLCDVGRAL